jgi:hypothetical protein
MSYSLTTGGEGTVATAQVVWSVDGQTYKFRSDNNFLSWITTIFTVADSLASVNDYRLLRPYPATQDTALGLNTNTAGGRSALIGVTTGISNTAFGSQALRDCNTGASNTAIGADALLSNQNGNANIAVGKEALKNINAPDANIGIGNKAGETLVTGGSNIIIGHEANVDDSGRQRCIVLGRSAISPALDGSLVIGATGGNAMTNLNVATAGGIASGEFLNIYINGVQRKIQLLLPS